MPGKRAIFAVITLVAACVALVSVQQRPAGLTSGQKWVATWAASVHGPYPSGNPSAQPDLKFAFPSPAEGAVDRSFRLIVNLVSRVRAKGNIKIVGATLTPSLTANGNSGTPEANQRRQAVNAFIRTGGLFDAVADFDAATVDPSTGAPARLGVHGPWWKVHGQRSRVIECGHRTMDVGLSTLD